MKNPISSPSESLTDQPLVSVCVATFQHAAFIKDCLDSILEQEADFPFEILVGEDCSTDGTREICIEYAERHTNLIRLFLRKEEDKIVMLGKKTGRSNLLGLFECARGKYICYCDGDDYWCDPHKLQKQVQIMESHPEVTLCITNTEIQGSTNPFPIGLPKTDLLLDSKMLYSKFYLGHISSWMMRNQMGKILRNPIVKKPIYLDQIFFLAHRLEGRVYYLSAVTSVYRFNPNGIYRGKSEKENHKLLYRHQWYLFKYLHKDPILYLRAIFYFLRRGAYILLWKSIRRKKD